MKPISRLLVSGLLIMSFAVVARAAEDTLPEAMERPDGFPGRPLTMIVPYGPAGGSGQVAAAMAEAVTGLTGVGINRDHKPGGGGVVGLGNFMAAPADGYTVLEHIDDTVSAFVSGGTSVDPVVDLVPLVISQITFSQIYIRADEDRFTDWNSFVEYARAQDGKVTIANVSRKGSLERVSMRFITDHHGIEIQQISFDKGGPRYAALKGGQVDALFEQPGDVRGFLESGDFKPILTLLKERPAAFDDVPSLTDVGLTFEPLLRFRGFFVRAGVPQDRLEWLQWAFQKAYFRPGYQAFNKSKFMDLVESFRDTEGAIALIQQTAEIYRDAYQKMGMTQ